MAKTELTPQILEACASSWSSDAMGKAYANAIMKNDLHNAIFNSGVKASLPDCFSIDLQCQGVSDQAGTARCWTFGSLNMIRHDCARRLNLRDKGFMLSQNYTFFWDQLEKANEFLNRVILRVDSAWDDENWRDMVRDPIRDHGQWQIFAFLAKKYGVVPKSAMPDTACSLETRRINTAINMKLRYDAKQLRDLRSGGADLDGLYARKEQMMPAYYGILCRFLGQPPKSFTFEHTSADGAYHRHENVTPQAFLTEFCGVNVEDYVTLIHHPIPNRPALRMYRFTDFPDEPGSRVGPYLSADMASIKQRVIAQLRDGEPVVMGCDVGRMSDKDSGLMDPMLFDYESALGAPMILGKADRILYRGTSGTHVMAFDGVNLGPDGAPDRWKVQNSYGEKMGVHGHYIMSDRWFEEYVLSVVIHKKHLSPEELAALDTEPVNCPASERY